MNKGKSLYWILKATASLPASRVCCTRKHVISKEFRFVERLRNLTIMLHKDFSPQKTWFEMTVKKVLQHAQQAGSTRSFDVVIGFSFSELVCCAKLICRTKLLLK
ncbi:hypothetical protein C0389_08045 [bacterium]|nr:hypothetical protein [bacterium]